MRLRNEGKFKTRFIVRFIRQDSNRNEWPEYYKFWSEVLDADKGDLIIRYDAHSWAGAISSKDVHLQAQMRDPFVEALPCYHVYDHFVVLADGTVPLCSEDWHKATVNFGNVTQESPIDIFNGKKWENIRAIHTAGMKKKLPLCSECTIHYSAPTRMILKPGE